MTNMELILQAREERAARQTELLNQHKKTLVCFTMNIPGEVKDSGLIRFAFYRGMELLENALGGVEACEALMTDAGPEAYFITDDSPEKVKIITVGLESANKVGRLFDMDVFSADGEKLSRPQRRCCMICGEPVDMCAKSKKHTVEEAREVVDCILADYAADYLADAAVESLLEEVHLTPKPGLVDEENSGSHADMDIALFEKSAKSLRDYFKTSVLLGLEDEECMAKLQPAGVEAEKAMFAATNGVNTHKGAIYAFGLILAAIGSHIAFDSEIFSTASLLASEGILPQENTHGTQVRMKYHKCGARYEAEEGFPNAISAFNVLLETGNPHRALLWLMASVQDTNVLYRGGADGLVYVQELAKKTQDLDDEHLMDGLREMDKKLTKHKLSPGGCADLLALGLFLQKTEPIWNEE